MRALNALVVLSAGCNSLLGISDPKANPGDGGPDGMIDSSIDAPPPCTTSIALGPEIVLDIGKVGTGFVVGDFDNGGVDDIAIATGDGVSIFHGNNTGAFGGDGMTVVVATPADDLAIEDFDSDGDDDLALWKTGGTSVVVRRQNRALLELFEAEQPLTGPFTSIGRVVEGQLDGNLRADLFVYDSGAGSRVYTSNLGTPGTFGRDNALVGAGADDLVLLRQVDNALREDAVFVNAGTVKLSLQSNSFGALGTIATGASSRGIAFGKFDGDNLVDLVVSTAQGLVLYRQNTATPGTFTMHGVISPLQSAAPMHVLDLNNDGRDDIVVANAVILQCAPAAAGQPGVFTQVEALPAAPPSAFRDVTGDGKPDLVRIDGQMLRVRVQ